MGYSPTSPTPSGNMMELISAEIHRNPEASASETAFMVQEAILTHCAFLYKTITGILSGELERSLSECVSPAGRVTAVTRFVKTATAFAHLDRTMMDKDHALNIARATVERPEGRGFVHLPHRGRIKPVLQAMEPGYDVQGVGWSKHGYFVRQKAGNNTNWRMPRSVNEVAYPKGASSMISVGLLYEALRENVRLAIDMCAAPGGKSLELIASLTGRNAKILCNDISGNRMATMQSIFQVQQTDQSGLRIDFDSLDAVKIGERMPNSADIVICDPPCSGLGKMYEPDDCVLPSLAFSEIMAEKQEKLLDSALHAVRPGGHVVYSTCTVSGAENEGVVEAIRRKWGNDIDILDPRDILRSDPLWPVDKAVEQSLEVQRNFKRAHHGNIEIRRPFPAVRIDGLTSPTRTTGFFAALLKKKDRKTKS